MTLPEFLTEDADGYIHVTGHRIGLQDLVYYYNDGDSAEALREAFPTLSLDLIKFVVAFYLEKKLEVDAYVADCEAEVERQRAIAPRGQGNLGRAFGEPIGNRPSFARHLHASSRQPSV